MALTNRNRVVAIPGADRVNPDWLGVLIDSASALIKRYCKRDLEQATYTEYYSGDGQQDILLLQWPVSSVAHVYFDQNGYWGQGSGAFGAATELTQGTQWALIQEDSSGSRRGMIRKLGSANSAFIGYYPENFWSGKLGARRLPSWPVGNGNLKIVYTAGYATIPDDLQLACDMMTMFLIRNVPSGAPLTSESLGAYSYSVGSGLIGSHPELGSVKQLLSPYREMVW